MPKLRPGLPLWVDRAPAGGRLVLPPQRGDLDVPVAIVGGGLTGVVTAYAFAAAGVRVALFEAARLGTASTTRGMGLALADPEGDYLVHEAAHGRRTARAIWQATHRAALDFAAAIRRLNIRCGLEGAEGVLYARDADEARRLKREAEARRSAGLDASWLTPRMLAGLKIEGTGAIRTRGHARLDPYRACIGFARAAATRGALLFERSAVRRVIARNRHVELVMGAGTVRCDSVVLATGAPFSAFAALRRHFTTAEGYAVATAIVPAAMRRAAPPAGLVVQDRQVPPHRLTWDAEGRMLWSGADQPPTSARTRTRVLTQRGGQLMYELSLLAPAISGLPADYVWDVPTTRALDGLPFIGPHRNYPRHLFALGLGASAAGAFLAARILLRQYEGKPDRTDEPFGFARLAR